MTPDRNFISENEYLTKIIVLKKAAFLNRPTLEKLSLRRLHFQIDFD